MIKWLFFDLGSTLIDESKCIEYRLSELSKQDNAPPKEILEKKMRENAAMNKLPYKDTVKYFGLQPIKWPRHLEKIYDEVPFVLERLSEKYKLGVIANQGPGAEERMIKYGIRDFFDTVIASAEAGVSKPDPEIFRLALRNAGCLPEEAYMIGDRFDNDIQPAAKMGMSTIWVRQEAFSGWNADLTECKPDITVDKVADILKYL